MSMLVCRIADALCRAAGVLSAVYLSLLSILAIAEIISRNVFSYSIPFATEYAGYLVTLILLTGLGWALFEGAHIRVNLLRERLPIRWQRRIDMAANLIGLCVSAFFAYALWDYALTTLARGTISFFPSQTPLAVPQLLMTVGPTTLVMAFIARTIRLHKGIAA